MRNRTEESLSERMPGGRIRSLVSFASAIAIILLASGCATTGVGRDSVWDALSAPMYGRWRDTPEDYERTLRAIGAAIARGWNLAAEETRSYMMGDERRSYDIVPLASMASSYERWVAEVTAGDTTEVSRRVAAAVRRMVDVYAILPDEQRDAIADDVVQRGFSVHTASLDYNLFRVVTDPTSGITPSAGTIAILVQLRAHPEVIGAVLDGWGGAEVADMPVDAQIAAAAMGAHELPLETVVAKVGRANALARLAAGELFGAWIEGPGGQQPPAPLVSYLRAELEEGPSWVAMGYGDSDIARGAHGEQFLAVALAAGKAEHAGQLVDIGIHPSLDALSNRNVLRRFARTFDEWLQRQVPIVGTGADDRLGGGGPWAFLDAWIEQTALTDVPYIDGDGQITSTALGRAIVGLRGDHLSALAEAGLRPDGAAVADSLGIDDGRHLHLAGWLAVHARQGALPPARADEARAIYRTIISSGFDLSDGGESFAGNLLHIGVQLGDLEITRMLVEAGLDTRLRAGAVGYPVDVARQSGYDDIVAYLDPLTYGATTTERVVIREVEQTPADETPPRIRLDPIGDQRGLTVVAGANAHSGPEDGQNPYDGVTSLFSLRVSGFVVDENGIAWVRVGADEAVFNNLGEFEIDVPLEMGENRIAVRAADEAGNEALVEMVVLREEARTLADELGIAGDYYALVIGNEAYTTMPVLRTPHEDATVLADILRSRFGFSTEVLLDADRTTILDALNRYVTLLQPEDRFILYYAGHGVFDEAADLAYWLPVDAEADNDTNWILANRITGSLRRMKAKHVAVISDSCYSGTLTRDVDVDLTGADRATNEYLRRMSATASRTILASGGNEPVADGGGGGHSVFARYLLDALRETEDEVFTLEGLFHRHIRVQVSGNSLQTPEYNTIRNSGHEGGDFVFVRR